MRTVCSLLISFSLLDSLPNECLFNSARFIASENTCNDRPFAINFPGAETDLPLELDLLEQNSPAGSPHPIHQPITALASRLVCSFGREAQAAYLYDAVLQATHIEDVEVKWTELLRLDATLQEFLAKIMMQSGTTWGLYCGSIAFSIGYAKETVLLASASLIANRALFAIHEYIIKHSEDASQFHAMQKASQAALAAAGRMVVEVARSFNQNSPTINIEILPPRCSHLVTAALHLVHNSVDRDFKEVTKDVEELRMMLKCLNRRWGFAGKWIAFIA